MTRKSTPEEARAIAAHAREQLPCLECGAAPGEPCKGPVSGATVHKQRYVAAAIEIKRQAKAARQTPGQAAEQAAALAALAKLPRVSREEIEACRTPAGGYRFTKERLAAWGVPWPPPPGWRQALEHGRAPGAPRPGTLQITPRGDGTVTLRADDGTSAAEVELTAQQAHELAVRVEDAVDRAAAGETGVHIRISAGEPQ